MGDLNTFETILVIFGALCIVIILCHIIIFEKAIIKSKVANANEVHHYYYLPQAQMVLTVTATVQVEKSAKDKVIINAEVTQLRFEPEIQIRPDTRDKISVTYHGNWFSNDELQIATSSSGLLENMKAISEDRLSSIVAQITKAPSSKLEGFVLAKGPERSETGTLIETVDVKRVFHVSRSELEEGAISRLWTIPLKGLHGGVVMQADASFTLIASTQLAYTAPADYDGLLTRPLVEQEWKLDNNDAEPVSFTCLVPDTGTVLKIPVGRSRFIRRQQLPKFKDGLLVENTIVKPSEMEGLISVPINILKAIMSIPAQLFQFRIAQVKAETEYDKALVELAKAKDSLNATAMKKLGDEVAELKKQSAGRTIPEQEPAALPQDEPEPKLGKLPPLPFVRRDAREAAAATTEAFISESFATAGLPPLKHSRHSWAKNNDIWDDYDNFQIKSCVPASAAYLLTSWTSNSNTPTKILTRKVVRDTLVAVAPNHDINEGCHMLTFLEHWLSVGMDGEKIDDYLTFKSKNPDLLRHAIYWFGGCLIGLQLPSSLKRKNEWFYNTSMENEEKEGHTVCAIGYDEDRFTVISFGKVIRMDSMFYQKFNDESYMVLSQKNWTTLERDKAPTDPAMNFEELKTLFERIFTIKL